MLLSSAPKSAATVAKPDLKLWPAKFLFSIPAKFKYFFINKTTDWSVNLLCVNDEPFGRTALEASSAGCAVIITDKGGLSEASPKAMKIKTLTVKNIENSIEKPVSYTHLTLPTSPKV